jgi:hypothetical protein
LAVASRATSRALTRLQRAVDTTLDDVCTGTNWLTLGDGSTPHPIVTDDTGTARAALWRDLSVVAPGTTFDIYFRLIENGTWRCKVIAIVLSCGIDRPYCVCPA